MPASTPMILAGPARSSAVKTCATSTVKSGVRRIEDRGEARADRLLAPEDEAEGNGVVEKPHDESVAPEGEIARCRHIDRRCGPDGASAPPGPTRTSATVSGGTSLTAILRKEDRPAPDERDRTISSAQSWAAMRGANATWRRSGCPRTSPQRHRELCASPASGFDGRIPPVEGAVPPVDENDAPHVR